MGFVGRNAQDKPSTRVILLDEPGLRNWNGKRMQLGEDAMASDVRDAEARLDESTAIVAPGDPGAHRDTDVSSAEQPEEPERGRPLVIVGDPGYQVDPSIFGTSQPRHARDDLRELVDAEFHLFDLS
jgi:hypothetical protein